MQEIDEKSKNCLKELVVFRKLGLTNLKEGEERLVFSQDISVSGKGY